MRRDVRKLLAKLNRNDFAYREFDDRFSETELWPIFVAVLGDRNVVGEAAAMLPSRHIGKEMAVPGHAPQKPALISGKRMAADHGVALAQPARRRDVDLREFLTRFSEPY